MIEIGVWDRDLVGWMGDGLSLGLYRNEGKLR